MENIEVREAERKAIQKQQEEENRFIRFFSKSFNIFYSIVAALSILFIAYLLALTIISQ